MSNVKLRLILKGLQQTNENEWTTVYRTIEVYAPELLYNRDWFQLEQRQLMTIEELYNWAKKNSVEGYEIIYRDDGYRQYPNEAELEIDLICHEVIL